MTRSVVASARVRVPATCGELLQGVDGEGPVLVSLPIDLDGTVEVTLVREPVVSVTPDLPKARAALLLALDRFDWRGGALVRLGGEVARGRGMGSSTIDVAGVIGGVAALRRAELPPTTLVSLMTAVEPSDSSPLPGLWAIDHAGGTRAQRLGDAPDGWWVVAVDSGRPVETLTAHAVSGPGPSLPPGTIARVSGAMGRCDAAAVAQVASEAAARCQERLAHPAFDEVLSLQRRHGALGVCVAHSGSIAAVICGDASQAATVATDAVRYGLDPQRWRVAAHGMRVEVRAAAAR